MDAMVLPMGESALLIEVEDTPAVLQLAAAIEARRVAGRWPQIRELVPAARTVLVVTGHGDHLGPLAGDLADLADSLHVARGPRGATAGPVVEIAVRYDGPDLADVARHCGLTEAEVIAAHTGTPWRVAFSGFAPGFAYLVGGDPRLRVPRRGEPRAAVPAGSVALAGEYSGIYPRETPGGWQLLGTTEAVLWSLERQDPALLRPGATVRFVEAPRDEPRRDQASTPGTSS